MHKKLITACLALVAFAAMAAVPALASASPVLTKAGVAVGTGSSITATNSGSIIFKGTEPTTEVVCEKSTMSGTVVKNSGTEIEGTIKSASFTNSSGGACSGGILGNITVTIPGLVSGTSHWCIKAGGKLAADAFELAGVNCGGTTGAPLTFILDTSLAGECQYKRPNNAALTGTFTTNTTPAPLNLTANQTFERENNNSFCSKTGFLTAAYTLEEGTTGLTIS